MNFKIYHIEEILSTFKSFSYHFETVFIKPIGSFHISRHVPYQLLLFLLWIWAIIVYIHSIPMTPPMVELVGKC